MICVSPPRVIVARKVGPAARTAAACAEGRQAQAERESPDVASLPGAKVVGAVHGSNSRRGVAALVALRKAAQEGKDLVFTPDGPRGPKYELQPGVIKIAQTAGCLISPFRIEFSSCWRLKTWDAFQIPKPFCKVVITMLEPLETPKDLDDQGFEKQRKLLEDVLREGMMN